MSLYSKEFQTSKSNYRLDYGKSWDDRNMYTAFFNLRIELIAAVKELILEFPFLQITKIEKDETI